MDGGERPGRAASLTARIDVGFRRDRRPGTGDTHPPLADNADGPRVGAHYFDIIGKRDAGLPGRVESQGQLVRTVRRVAAGLDVEATVTAGAEPV